MALTGCFTLVGVYKDVFGMDEVEKLSVGGLYVVYARLKVWLDLYPGWIDVKFVGSFDPLVGGRAIFELA